jgi:hypothetical protein
VSAKFLEKTPRGNLANSFAAAKALRRLLFDWMKPRLREGIDER